MNVEQRLGAGAAVALMLLSLAACGGSKGTSAVSTSATSARTTTPAAAATHASAAATTAAGSSTAPRGATGTKSCPGGDVSGVIGGASKCLHAGQECSQKHAADYTQYGFACAQQGQKYILTKK